MAWLISDVRQKRVRDFFDGVQHIEERIFRGRASFGRAGLALDCIAPDAA
jgi:hypothetical protein